MVNFTHRSLQLRDQIKSLQHLNFKHCVDLLTDLYRLILVKLNI